MADFAAQDAPPGALNLVADSEAMLASGVFPEHKLCRGVFGKMGDVVDLGTLGDSGPQVSPSVNGVTRAMAGPLRSITSPRHHAFHSSSCHGPIFLFRKNLHLLSIIHFDHAPTHAHACTMHHAPCTCALLVSILLIFKLVERYGVLAAFIHTARTNLMFVCDGRVCTDTSFPAIHMKCCPLSCFFLNCSVSRCIYTLWAASFTRDGFQLLTLSYTPLLVSSSFSAMVVGARRTATHRHHCMRAQAHARLKGLVDHAEVNIGTAKAAVLGMERLRDTALLRALQVTTREVAINKATPSVHIGAQLATEHTKEFFSPSDCSCRALAAQRASWRCHPWYKWHADVVMVAQQGSQHFESSIWYGQADCLRCNGTVCSSCRCARI